MLIKINIKEKRAQVLGSPVIVCGNTDHVVEFAFDEEWAASQTRTARFVYVQDGAVKYTDVVFTGSTAAVPLLSNTKEVRVGVFAGDLRTTTPARIPCEPSILCGTGAPEDPTPSQYDQIIALLNSKQVLDAVLFSPQELGEEQKGIARENIGAASTEEVGDLRTALNEQKQDLDKNINILRDDLTEQVQDLDTDINDLHDDFEDEKRVKYQLTWNTSEKTLTADAAVIAALHTDIKAGKDVEISVAIGSSSVSAFVSSAESAMVSIFYFWQKKLVTFRCSQDQITQWNEIVMSGDNISTPGELGGWTCRSSDGGVFECWKAIELKYSTEMAESGNYAITKETIEISLPTPNFFTKSPQVLLTPMGGGYPAVVIGNIYANKFTISIRTEWAVTDMSIWLQMYCIGT